MFNLTYCLLAKKLVPNPLWEKSSYRWKFFIRTLITPVQNLRWLNYLANHPMLNEILKAQPSLPVKLHRPYLAKNLSKTQCQDALRTHYEFIYSQLTPAMQTALYQVGEYQLAEIEGKDASLFKIFLRSEDQLNREGELTLSFTDQAGTVLTRLTFIFMTYQNKLTMFIGGQQGAHADVAHAEIQKATKACYGLFPKRLIIDAARNMCNLLNIEQIVAVGNATHIYHNWRYNLKKRNFLTDYDEFWRSLGAIVDQQGYYHIPIDSQQRPLENIASKKRAEYRRRYELLDQLQQQVTEHYLSTASC